MTLNEYQQAALATNLHNLTVASGDENELLMTLALGLTSEVGEVAGKLYKAERDGLLLDYPATAAELGDCLWHLAVLAKAMGYSLEEIAQKNVDKLASRKARGVLSGGGDER